MIPCVDCFYADSCDNKEDCKWIKVKENGGIGCTECLDRINSWCKKHDNLYSLVWTKCIG